jgi:hypothetical protein
MHAAALLVERGVERVVFDEVVPDLDKGFPVFASSSVVWGRPTLASARSSACW